MNYLKDIYNRSILGWFALSFAVAWWMPITADEALYFVYGRNLAWGFHDHPPMVALFTVLGNFAPSALLVRLPGILALTFAFLLGDRIVKERQSNRSLFHLGWWMIPILHVYGIVITPDVPLLFFTMLLWWCLHRWIQTEKLPLLFILVLAGLMYSKYHGAIVIALALFPMRRFWKVRPLLASFIAFLLFIPHLWWQYENDWNTFRYHFVDRKGEFEWQHLGGFIGAQIGLFNPFLWFLVVRRRLYKRKADEWGQLHQRVFFGLLLFFTFMVLRGRAEAHWAAAGSFSLLFLLSEVKFEQGLGLLKKWSLATIALLFFARIPLVIDTPLNLDFFEERRYINAVHTLAGDAPVAFMNSYSRASEYQFYTGEIAHSINNISGGLSQYQVWQYDTALVNRPFLWVANDTALKTFSTIESNHFQLHAKWVENYQTIEKLWFELVDEQLRMSSGRNALNVQVVNRSEYSIDMAKAFDFELKLYVNYKKPGQMILSIEHDGLPEVLTPGARYPVQLKFDLPENTAGEYWFKISAEQNGAPNYINSNRCFLEIID